MKEHETTLNFSALIASISSTALASMGQIDADKVYESVPRDLDLAKHNIDLLLMLREKTKGNLSQEEQALLKNCIYDTQMRYLEEVKKQGGN